MVGVSVPNSAPLAKSASLDGEDSVPSWHRGSRKATGKNILLTGGCGFIGSHTVERLLRNGDNVSVVDTMNAFLYEASIKEENLQHILSVAEETGSFLKVYKVDITDKVRLEEIFQNDAIEYVCHLAARAGVRPSIADPAAYIHTNITGQVVLLQLAQQFKIKNFTYASSSSVYGGNTVVPFSESHRVDNPVSPYAASKKAGEMMARSYHNMFKIPCIGLRFFTVYGPRGRPDMAPYLFTHKIAQGLPIQQFGDGSSSRDYTYIDDIVQGVVGALYNPKECEVYNLGNSSPVTLKEFIATIEGVVGKKAIINQVGKQTGDVDITYADVSKAKADFGYEPNYPLTKGLGHFYDWYCKHIAPAHAAAASIESTPASKLAKAAPAVDASVEQLIR